MAYLSYQEALGGLLSKDDADGVVGIINQHKGWGSTTCRLPSHIIVLLVDEVKRLREQVGGYEKKPVVEP